VVERVNHLDAIQWAVIGYSLFVLLVSVRKWLR
jgi:hypothetical protein